MTPRSPLTDLQTRTLRAVLACRSDGVDPRLSELGTRLGHKERNPTSVASVLRSLRSHGCLTWVRADYATIEVTEKGKALAPLDPAPKPKGGRPPLSAASAYDEDEDDDEEPQRDDAPEDDEDDDEPAWSRAPAPPVDEAPSRQRLTPPAADRSGLDDLDELEQRALDDLDAIRRVRALRGRP